MKIVRENILLKLMFSILKNYNDLLFLPERTKIGNVEKLLTKLHDKKNMLIMD